MIDPWPRASANRNIAFNGEKAATASERYRTGRVIPPVNATHQLGRLHARRSSRRSRLPTAQASSAPAGRQQQQPPRRRSDERVRVDGMTRSTSAANKTGVAVLTADPAFEQSVRSTFGASAQIELASCPARSATPARQFDIDGATVVIIDLDAGRDEEMQALRAADAPHRRLAAGRRGHPEPSMPRSRAACCRCGSRISWSSRCSRSNWCATCARVARPQRRPRRTEAQIYTFLPGGRRRRRHHAGDPDRAAAAQQRPARPTQRPAWSISISSTAPAPIISISSRGSTSRRSSRGRSGSTGSCWRSCCRTTPPGLR